MEFLEASVVAFEEVDIVHTSIEADIEVVDTRIETVEENDLASEMEMEIVPFAN
jgi:hypothetical protein